MDLLLDPTLYSSMLRAVTPILLAALGGALCARVGLFNVGLEGLILIGAFSGIVGNHLTGNIWLALLFAMLCVMLFSLMFAFITIHLKANVIVVGVAINFLAMGLTTFSLRAIFNVKGSYRDTNMVGLPRWDIPLVQDIPWLGKIISGHSPLVYLGLLMVGVLYVYMFRTVSGFRLRAAGENPIASRSLGIRVTRYQYGAMLACGALCGLAGAQLSLGQLTMFSEGMSSGRGFIALVATMLGQANPLGVGASSLLFGFTSSLGSRLQGMALPTQFTSMLPFVVTLLAMFFFRNKNQMADARRSNESSR